MRSRLFLNKSGLKTAGFAFIHLLVFVAVLATFSAIVYFVYFNPMRSQASLASGRNVIGINAKKVIGSVDRRFLGNYNDSGNHSVFLTPYPYNEWSYLNDLAGGKGSSYLKKMGVTNEVLTFASNDWRNPFIAPFGIQASTWFSQSDPQGKQACDPLIDTENCTARKNVGGYCAKYIETPLVDWLRQAASYGGPITFVTNIDQVYHMKKGFYTYCNQGEGQPRVKKENDPNFNGPVLDISQEEEDVILKKLLDGQYVEKADTTPQDTIDFLEFAKRSGTPISYVEISMEPWNRATPKNLDPTEYIKKLRRWYKAIKDYDPSIKVGAAALQIRDVQPEKLNDPKVTGWNYKLFRAGKIFDFIVMHHYIGFNPSGENALTSISPKQASNFSYPIPAGNDERFIYHNSAGDTSMMYRNQLIAYSPADMHNIPIHLAFNVWGPLQDVGDHAPNAGSRLFTGLSNASFVLNELWPQKIGMKYYPGVKYAFIGGLEGANAWFFPPQSPDDPNSQPVFLPTWKIFEILSQIKGKNILEINQVGAPVKNSQIPGRDALETRAVINKAGTVIRLIFINHDANNTVATDINLANFKAKKDASVASVGDGEALSLTSFNDYANPTNISINKRNVLLKIDDNGNIKNFPVPPHTFLILTISSDKFAGGVATIDTPDD